jgi:transcriptional regulator with XRE-family HTH domain
MAILDPKALIEARKTKGWTQLQLSEATKPQINVSTISRIERRKKASRVRERTVKQFADALGVQSTDLCKDATSEPDLVKVSMNVRARNALALVARRYKISRRLIIELAPLLFYVAAEQSLRGRRKRLEELRDAAKSFDELRSEVIAGPPLPPGEREEELEREDHSIQLGDIFGHFSPVRCWDDEYNPFVAFLDETLEAVLGPEHPDREFGSVRSGPTDRAELSYGICFEEAAEIVGGDESAAMAIIAGRVALHEMPKGTPAERAEWARTKLTGAASQGLGSPHREVGSLRSEPADWDDHTISFDELVKESAAMAAQTKLPPAVSDPDAENPLQSAE